MPNTPTKMHMYDIVKIETMVFEIVGGGADRYKLSEISRIGHFANK